MAADLLADLIKANLWAAAGILLVLLLRRPVRRLFGASLAYGLWVIVPLAVAAAFLPARRGPPVAAAPQTAPAPSMDALSAAGGLQPRDYTLIILWLWAVGIVLTLALLAWRQQRFTKALGRLRADPIGGVVRAANPGVGPAVVGALAPKIVIPADFEKRFTPEERAVVLAHERVHLDRQDARINAFVALAQAFGWFNPLVHLAAFQLRIDQELACDAVVIARQPDRRRRYAEALLKTQADTPPLPLGCCWPSRSPHPLKERITMLKASIPSRTRRILGAGFLGTVVLTAAAVAWASQPARPAALELATVSAAPPNPLSPTNMPRAVRAADTPNTAPVASPRPGYNAEVAEFLRTNYPELPAEVAPAPSPQVEASEPQRLEMLAQLTDAGTPVAVPTPSVITRPDWVRWPTAADVQRFYPERALRMQKSGSARLRCRIDGSGMLQNCAVITETPTEFGFGMAALKMESLFQMKPSTIDGASVGGALVYVTIHFADGA